MSDIPATYQVGGTHYTDLTVQPWDAMQAWLSPEAFRGFLHGNVIKYLARYGHKEGSDDDLRKAFHYLHKLLSLSDPVDLVSDPIPQNPKASPGGRGPGA